MGHSQLFSLINFPKSKCLFVCSAEQIYNNIILGRTLKPLVGAEIGCERLGLVFCSRPDAEKLTLHQPAHPQPRLDCPRCILVPSGPALLNPLGSRTLHTPAAVTACARVGVVTKDKLHTELHSQ